MTQQDYSQILGVNKEADQKTIKDSYRGLAFTYHPDRNEANPDSADKMKQINEAYAVLSDTDKRREYDAMRTRFGENAYGQFRNTYSEQDIFSGSDVHHIFEEMARSFGLRGVDSIFSDFYGPGYRHFEFKKRGLHGKGFIYRGRGGRGGRGRFGKYQGRGMMGNPPAGIGRFTRYLLEKVTGMRLPQAGQDIRDTIQLPEELAVSGGPYAYHHRRRSKKLVVNIPAETREGQQIRLAKMGVAGKNGGPSGDLYLKVKIRKPLFKKAKDYIVSSLRR